MSKNKGNLMIQNHETSADLIRVEYEKIIRKKYPRLINRWPIVSGCNFATGEFNNYILIFFQHTGIKNRTCHMWIDKKFLNFIDNIEINDSNLEKIKDRLGDFYDSKKKDVAIIIKKNEPVKKVIFELLNKHEIEMGVAKLKIFLSHKGIDKEMVKDFEKTLRLIGYDPWIDVNMEAGLELNREILKGFNDSCAAIFFITENFKDEEFLADEVDYAINEKREKKENFSIITLVFNKNDGLLNVPNLLKKYVVKNPKT